MSDPLPQTPPPVQAVYYQQRPTNVLAIVAFVFAFFVSLVAIICGYVALGQIKRTGEGGHGLALAAVILGWIGIGLGVVFGIIYAVVVIGIISSQGPA